MIYELKVIVGNARCNKKYTRSYYRDVQSGKSPTYNIEIANNTLYVLIYFISKGLDYSTVITTLHYITANGVYIFTALYCTLRSTLGFQVCVSVFMSMEFSLPNKMLIAVIH